eukprot:Em0016g1003a
MGRTNRRKKRTHQDVETETTAPKSFVIERGKVGTTLHHLVLDLRRVMEPNTATKLKVRHKNVVKDFIQVAGPLGCTHMMILSRTESYINLRVCKLPRGPTITFHIKAFTLCHEVVSSLKKPAVNAKQFLTPALLILNNFSPESKPLTLMTSLFQNMFPSVNIHKVKLSEIRRCVLLNYIADTNTIEFRHYNIKATPQGVSRGIKKLVHSHVPDLGKYTDISDLVLGGNVSESEGEELVGGEGAEVTLPQDLPGRGNIKSEQSAIRLTELGPRLTLQLVKVESGLCGGEVLHHEFIQKTKREAKELKTRVEGQRRLKEKRRSEQERNIQRKIKEKELHRQRCLEGQKGDLQDGEEDGEEEKGEEEKGDDDDDDDAEWYKQEVGEEPDPARSSGTQGQPHGGGVVQLVPPLVEGVVQLVPPLAGGVVQLVPPLAGGVVQLVPPLAGGVVQLVPPLAGGVVQLVPPLAGGVVQLVPPLAGGVVVVHAGTEENQMICRKQPHVVVVELLVPPLAGGEVAWSEEMETICQKQGGGAVSGLRTRNPR